MKNPKENNLVSYGDFILPPVIPGAEVNNLCNEIDRFYKKYPRNHKKQKASDLIKGAFYAMRTECRNNPDWMSQAANSAREVILPFWGGNDNSHSLINILKKYLLKNKNSNNYDKFLEIFNRLDVVYRKLNDITHHGVNLTGKGFLNDEEYLKFQEKDFPSLMNEFVYILKQMLTLQQLYGHKLIDIIIKRKKWTKVLKEDLNFILNYNNDLKFYFFTQAPIGRIDWLGRNNFLEIIKEKSEDPTKYSYKTPELNYLVRIAKIEPMKVVQIMKGVPISKDTFNPEVIDQFIRICADLPAKELAEIVPKLKKDNWVELMAGFNQWGFEYGKMFETLSSAKEDKSILTLAEAILMVRPKEKQGSTFNEGPFYFNDLSYTKVFKHLVSVSDEYAKGAFALATKLIGEIVLLGGKNESNEVFPIKEIYSLYDVDFFTLNLGRQNRLSHRADIRELVAVIKLLAERLIGENCAEEDEVKEIYKNIELLPQSRTMWRLRLFVWSLCPQVFKKELKHAFFRLFEVETYYHEIIGGAEYKTALQKGFAVLDNDDQREYVQKVIEYFVKQDKEKENEKENWHLRYGSQVLSVIVDCLTPTEKDKAEKAGFKLDPNYKPESSITDVRGGAVVPRGPITQEEFGKLSIEEIADKMRTDWTPEKLSRQNTEDDFMNPLNAEGAGELLRSDIPKRLQDYINNANLFFDRNKLDKHYTYSFLRGLQEVIKNNKEVVKDINWDKFITLSVDIKKSGEANAFGQERRKRDSYDAWLAGWNTVHSALTDVIQELLNEKSGFQNTDFQKYRKQLFEVISYLFNYPDPEPKDEQIETASSKTKSPNDSDYMVSDPFSMAINTVRGQAFQVFVLFVYRDGEKFKKDDKVKIDKEVKMLYEKVLEKEDTRALMFMFGHYLPTFYFRDKEWIRKLLPQIFSTETNKKRLYTAAWEGYLSNNLYEDMFFDSEIQKLYKRGLDLTEDDYPTQKHFKDPDEGFAIHLALAFVNYEVFGFEDVLFQAFWNKKDLEQHAKFISFIGRFLISGNNVQAKAHLEKNLWVKKRLVDFWDWVLKNHSDKQLLEEFAFWINTEKGIFKPVWLAEHIKKTLIITKGSIDWDYGLSQSVITLAKEAPADTIDIARLYIYEGGVNGDNRRIPLYVDDEWREALEILYSNSLTKSKTIKLIDDLIRDGGSAFWKLKEILGDSD